MVFVIPSVAEESQRESIKKNHRTIVPQRIKSLRSFTSFRMTEKKESRMTKGETANKRKGINNGVGDKTLVLYIKI